MKNYQELLILLTEYKRKKDNKTFNILFYKFKPIIKNLIIKIIGIYEIGNYIYDYQDYESYCYLKFYESIMKYKFITSDNKKFNTYSSFKKYCKINKINPIPKYDFINYCKMQIRNSIKNFKKIKASKQHTIDKNTNLIDIRIKKDEYYLENLFINELLELHKKELNNKTLEIIKYLNDGYEIKEVKTILSLEGYKNTNIKYFIDKAKKILVN